MSNGTVYLVTGANRGIGAELSKQILQKPGTRLVAGARNPDAASLKELQQKYGERLLRVRIDLLDFTTVPVRTAGRSASSLPLFFSVQLQIETQKASSKLSDRSFFEAYRSVRT